MGMIEIIVALCLQAEPSACRVIHERRSGSPVSCLLAGGDDEDLGVGPGWYRARYSCRWRR